MMRLNLSELCRVRTLGLLQNFRATRFNLVEMTTQRQALCSRNRSQKHFGRKKEGSEK